MDIIQQKVAFCHQIVPLVPKQISGLFKFGLEALSFQTIKSLRSNARLMPLSWHTAKTKMCRLLANTKIQTVFLGLLQKSNLINEHDIVAIDFSDFKNGLQVLMFAKQTKKGRAIPIYFEILRHPILEKNSQNIFVITAIKKFVKLIGSKPTLVFDRGFACPSIIQFLSSKKHPFIIRVKKVKKFLDEENHETFLAKDATVNDIKVIAYGHRLRLIISDKPTSGNDPWYLVTNIMNATRDDIITRYYHRFEIEEFFRDAKRLLGLEGVNFKKEQSLAVALWFVILTVWFCWKMESTISEAEEKLRKEMKLSYVRYFFENLQKTIFQTAEREFQLNYLYLNPVYEKV